MSAVPSLCLMGPSCFSALITVPPSFHIPARYPFFLAFVSSLVQKNLERYQGRGQPNAERFFEALSYLVCTCKYKDLLSDCRTIPVSYKYHIDICSPKRMQMDFPSENMRCGRLRGSIVSSGVYTPSEITRSLTSVSPLYRLNDAPSTGSPVSASVDDCKSIPRTPVRLMRIFCLMFSLVRKKVPADFLSKQVLSNDILFA